MCDTLIETNHTYDFFVNWAKVTNNRNAFKYEVALLKSLRNSSKPTSDFEKLISRYPEVVKVIPILLACRDGIMKVLDSIEPVIQYKNYNFSKKSYNSNEIKDIVKFTEKTGLLNMLCKMESATDYLLGVEVGIDTNARKNRSGDFLEKMVEEIILKQKKQNPALIFEKQKKFSYIEDKYNLAIPSVLSNRKFDWVIINNSKAINIETNFYSGTGSKPSEIVDSYVYRGKVLSSSGWKFAWLTDGEGWKKMRNPLRNGVDNIDYTLNVNLLRKGALEKIITLR